MDGILTHRQIETLLADGCVRARRPFEPVQCQPTTLDLRLGEEALVMGAGFLPRGGTVQQQARALVQERVSLADGAVLRRGRVYLVRLLEDLALPGKLRARANPRSSTGRIDVFTRTLVDHHERFDDVPPGYRGPLWLELLSRSFDIRVQAGQRLNQLRFLAGHPLLQDEQLTRRVRAGELGVPSTRRTVAPASLLLGVSLRPDTPGAPCGWRARLGAPVLDLSRDRGHAAQRFFSPVHPDRDGSLTLQPEAFYLLASVDRLRLPPDLAAEMLPWDVGMGELRTNYAGFFDSGFGWDSDASSGARAVLEVRAHDVPFRIEHGQTLFRLQFSRTLEPCTRLYGDPSSAYQHQGLALARYFR